MLARLPLLDGELVECVAGPIKGSGAIELRNDRAQVWPALLALHCIIDVKKARRDRLLNLRSDLVAHEQSLSLCGPRRAGRANLS